MLFSELSRSSLFKRLISAAILAPVILYLIYYGSWPFVLLILLSLLIAISEWVRLYKALPYKWHHFLFGIFYIIICFISFGYSRFIADQSYLITFSLILTVWASDIGTYFVGKYIGGPKLAEKISPNKTWAGLFGSMVGAALVLSLSSIYVLKLEGFNDQVSLFLILFYGLFIGVVGQVGDLFISFLKRKAGVKDTGHIIPGHGGILDRIDSLMLVSPFFLCIVHTWKM